MVQYLLMLSIVLLTKNNASTIETTLASAAFADEIIIIDDYSNDDTLQIARKYSVKSEKRHLDGDFAAQRNYGLTKAKGDWVFFLDSDEIISKDLQKEIRDSISRAGTDEKGIAGYYVKRDDIFFGKKLLYGETAHVKLLRLGRKNAGRWIRPVHEIWDIKGRTETLTVPLLHTSHDDVAQFIDAINWYTTINAKHLYEDGVKASIFSIVSYPTVKFIRNYILCQGYRDGTRGMFMALMMSFHSFLTRAKLYMFWHKATSV